MPFADCNGLRIHYEMRGKGPPLLFINGTGADLRRAPNALERQLSDDFQVLMFDQRGMGQSGKPDAPCTMADYGADAAALLDHVAWERVPVLGYSFGGMVAQELALGHVQKVERLVLLSTTSGGAGGASYPLHELAPLPPRERARRMVELGDTRRNAAWQQANARLFTALLEEALAGILLGADEPGHAQGALRQLEARRRHDTWERLPRLALPVLVCAGEYDGIAPVAFQEALAGRIPGARLERFQGGHLFFLQDGRACARIVQALS